MIAQSAYRAPPASTLQAVGQQIRARASRAKVPALREHGSLEIARGRRRAPRFVLHALLGPIKTGEGVTIARLANRLVGLVLSYQEAAPHQPKLPV